MPPSHLTVADLPRLRRARVDRIAAEATTAERLAVLGFAPGTEVAFVRRAPFVGPLIVEVRGTQVCLRVVDARRILVSELEAR